MRFTSHLLIAVSTCGLIACGGVPSGGATLEGAKPFAPKSAVVRFEPNDQGGVNQGSLGIAVTNQTKPDACNGSSAQSTSYVRLGLASSAPLTVKSYVLLTTSQLVQSPPPDGATLLVGTQPAAAAPQDVNIDQSGSVTVSELSWPKALADGGMAGGSVKGTFSASIHLQDGGTSALSGAFDALPCSTP